MDYPSLKHFHMGCAALSGSLFLLRGAWMLRASPLLRQRWVRIAPHVVDTLLLASAIGLALWSRQYPGQQPWLTAKLAALLGYIVLGSVALKRGRTPGQRRAAFVAALLLFAYIVTVAITKRPLP
ncbi:MAG: SirB2 family protein [Telluria sp.]